MSQEKKQTKAQKRNQNRYQKRVKTGGGSGTNKKSS